MHTTTHHNEPLSKRDTVADIALAELIGLDEDDLDTLESGRDIRIPCPAHGGDDDNMSITLGDQGRLLFHCFSQGCSSAEIVAAIRGAEVVEHTPRLRVVKDAPKQLSPEAQHRLESVCGQWAKKLQELDELHPAWVLLKNRGIDREQAKKLGLGYGGMRGGDELDHELGMIVKTPEGSMYSTFQPYRHRLIVPLYDPEGILLGFAGRALDDDKRKWINPSSERYDKSSYLYGESTARELLKDTRTLVICEGYWDQIACTRNDLAAVAIGGTSLAKSQISRVVDLHPELVVWAADGDVPGRMAGAKGAANLAAAELTVAAISAPDAKDPADWDGLAASVEAATPATVSDLINLALIGVDLDDETAQKSAASCVKQILKSWPDASEAKAAMTPQLAHSLGLKVGKLREGVSEDDEETVAKKLVRLLSEHYTFHRDSENELWVAEIGSHAVQPLSFSIMESVAMGLYLMHYGEPARSSAASDAVKGLAGMARKFSEPIATHKRVCDIGGKHIIDLGGKDDLALFIEAGQPPVIDTPPDGVYFERGRRYGQIPTLRPGVSIDALWRHLLVEEEDRPIVLAWLMACWSPCSAVPIMILEGPAGASKSTTARRLISLVDPVNGADSGLRSQPRDEAALSVSLSSSRVVSFDNLSWIDKATSDKLCIASYPGGIEETRRLFSDKDVAITKISAAILLTGIDLGTLRGDLGSRTASVRLNSIDKTARRDDEDLSREWERDRPGIIWALAELMGQVLAILPSVKLEESPRIVSFGKMLAALDSIMGTDGLAEYLRSGDERQMDVAMSDSIVEAIVQMMASYPSSKWAGNATKLLKMLNTSADWQAPPKDWPATPAILSKRLGNLASPLEQRGVKWGRQHNGTIREITLERITPTAKPSTQPELDDGEDEDDFDFEPPPTASKTRAAKTVESPVETRRRRMEARRTRVARPDDECMF